MICYGFLDSLLNNHVELRLRLERNEQNILPNYLR